MPRRVAGPFSSKVPTTELHRLRPRVKGDDSELNPAATWAPFCWSGFQRWGPSLLPPQSRPWPFGWETLVWEELGTMLAIRTRGPAHRVTTKDGLISP